MDCYIFVSANYGPTRRITIRKMKKVFQFYELDDVRTSKKGVYVVFGTRGSDHKRAKKAFNKLKLSKGGPKLDKHTPFGMKLMGLLH